MLSVRFTRGAYSIALFSEFNVPNYGRLKCDWGRKSRLNVGLFDP